MPATRKQQILFKKQSSKGVNAAPGAGDAVLVYEPTISNSNQKEDRAPAGPSLSRAVTPVGRRERAIGFQSDFRGSGSTASPPVAPDWGDMVECCALERVRPRKIPVTGVSSAGFQLGEIVRKDATNRGVVIGLFIGTSYQKRLAAAGDVIVVPLEGDIDSGTLTGESSGCTGTIGTPADYNGWAYKPTSDELTQLEAAAAFSGGSAPTPGDVVTIKASGVQVGIAQVIEITAGTPTTMQVTMLEGTVADTNTVHFGAASTTLTEDPVLTKTPVATIRHNLDGRRRDLIDARGDFELSADAGNNLKFAFTFNGDAATAADALPIATSGLSTIVAPRFMKTDGALAVYARTVDVPGGDTAVPLIALPTKTVSLSSGNTVSPDEDANSESGSRGGFIGDRDPTFGCTVNAVQSGFDWEDFAENSRTIHLAIAAGKTQGNIVGCVIPNGQVDEASPGDSNGIVTFENVIKPRRVLEGGDDEYYLFQL